MTRDWDVVVVGLGALGSAAAYWSARVPGTRVLALERYEIGHPNGASEDVSRIIRRSYHRRDYVRLTARAYDTWAEVERESRPFLLVRWGPAMNPVLAQIDLQTEPTIELPIETVLHLLRRGIGAAFMTRTFVMDDLAAGRLVEVAVHDLPPLLRESTLVRPARRGPPATATADFVARDCGILCSVTSRR